MTAKELFEELGFEMCVNKNRFIIYAIKHEKNASDNDPFNWDYVRFDIEDKTYYVDIMIGEVDCKLHNAIHKQCQELGWLDDYERKLIEFIKSDDFSKTIIQSKDSLQNVLIQLIEEQLKIEINLEKENKDIQDEVN